MADDGKKNGDNIAKQSDGFLTKIRNFIKEIPEKIKLITSPIGQVLGWLLLIILIVILFSVIGKAATRAIARLVGINWNYKTYDKDLEVIRQLNVSGYERTIDADNFQDFKAYEYAVLMDAAEYLRNTKQEMFDIVENEGEYEFERELIKNKKPEEYNAKIAELSQKYANVGGGSNPASVKLMDVFYETNQGNSELLSDSRLQSLIDSSANERNVTVGGIDAAGTVKGGTNRVNGPFLVYEFKENSFSGDRSGDRSTTSTSNSTTSSENTEQQRAKYNKIIYIGDDRTAQIYYTKNGWNEASTSLEQYDGENNFWMATTDAEISWMETIAIPSIENEIEDKTAIVFLLGLNDVGNTNAGQYASLINSKAAEWKNEGAETFFVSINPVNGVNDENIKNEDIVRWNNSIKSELSSNVKYIDTYSQIIGTAQFNNWKYYSEKTNNDIYNIIINNVNEYPATSYDKVTYSLSGDGNGSLEPYIYVTRDNIEFSYYFDANNKVIEYPLLLNAYNASLNSSTENSAEVNRALLGISPVVFPDINVNEYTKTPYYSNKTTSVVYKIPLRTILGRYMPKAELLNAWSYIKQSVERDTEEITDEGFMDYTIEAIKGIYNEACLLGEDTKTISDGNDSGDTVEYTADDSNKKTFVTFEKAGIESTKYDIEGLQPINGEDGDPNIKIVTNFISAIVINPTFDVEYKTTYTMEDPNADVGLTPSISEEAQPANTLTTIIEDKMQVSLDNLRGLLRSDGLELVSGNFILADGTPEEGYTPPSSLEGIDGYYIRTQDAGQVNSIAEKVKNAVKSYIQEQISEDSELNGIVEITNIPNDIVRFNPIFLANETAEVTQKLKIEHIRMPVLLVKSATTWCREVTYNHRIVQNQFKQNNKRYIIPKSVSSIGVQSFNTTVESEGYRGRAYSEVFSKIQEKDVINMLMMLEMSASEGSNDSYEYMRDLYKLVLASRDYSKNHGHTSPSDSRFIHEDTYKYVHIPDSILYFDDSQSQKMYWLELLTATMDDPITQQEMNQFRTKDRDITWQLVEYEKYDECNTSGSTKVYALNPFGSQYVRTYFETMYRKSQDVSGAYRAGSHNGADWSGRTKVSDIFEMGKSANTADNIGGNIYNYELNHLSRIYGEESAKTKLKEVLQEEKKNMPIVAVAPGKVVTVAYSARSGFYVGILHSNEENTYTYYMHMKRWPLVNVGDYVGAGTLLGYEGSTGRSFGAHLHFQLEKNDRIESPENYIFPTFNPFYYEDKAAEVGYDLTSEYMSLQRTVSMVGTNAGSEARITNKVPRNALVIDYSSLIQNQGSMQDRNYTYDGELDWNSSESFDGVRAFSEGLKEQNIFDIYLRKAFFDKKLAIAEGYLVNPLSDILAGDIIVKTDVPGALPSLTKSELKTMLDGYLNARYKSKAKVDWLMKNVFTDANLDFMLAKEKETNVSIVFMIAVSVQEQNLGLADNKLSKEAHNIFSIKGVDPEGGYILYQHGKKWRNFKSYKAAMNYFMDLIANGNYYFKKGNYSIGTIGRIYCEGNAWAGHVTSHVIEIMKYYPGNWVAPSMAGESLFTGENPELMSIIKNCMAFYVDNNFKYCQGSAGRLIPPYDSSGKVRQKKHVCNSCSKNCSSPAYRTDCSTYVSWVIYEYAKANGFTDLQNEFSRQHSSYDFQSIGSKLRSGRRTGFYKYLQLVQYGIGGKNFRSISSRLQPGDILVFREGDGHHVEFVGESGTKVYSCGSNPTSKSAKSSYTRRSDATCAIRLLTPEQVNSR
ncbi:MAG: peptidoglycan DD-metalloendopeptidase family protein [Clostridia bacterium]|nr:peptidoglycan DD-metalloendopeptidase family protein [Clostridia bacterium]